MMLLGASSQAVVATVALFMMAALCGAFAVYFFVRFMREGLGTAERSERLECRAGHLGGGHWPGGGGDDRARG